MYVSSFWRRTANASPSKESIRAVMFLSLRLICVSEVVSHVGSSEPLSVVPQKKTSCAMCGNVAGRELSLRETSLFFILRRSLKPFTNGNNLMPAMSLNS